MNLPRRTFLKGILATSGAVALGTLPPAVMAEWPQTAFQSTTVEGALNALFESPDSEETDKITIIAPEMAANGESVPVEVKVDLPKVESITIIADKNPVPLVARFKFADNGEGYVKTRIRMAKTSNIVTVVKADGKLYTARQEVKITVGGCGG